MNIVAWTLVSLDGVMQSPARPDEDRRGGFEHGGWAAPYADALAGARAGQSMSATDGGGLLFGRRTYEDFYEVWPKRTDGNIFTEVLDRRQKYVVSRTLEESLPWANSTLLKGEAETTVAQLKARPGGSLVVLGSGELLRSLTRCDLVDEYTLLIHPVVLGSGRRLFANRAPRFALELVDETPTTTGVVIATYRRKRSA
jgi:dihydrofolate reductase